ncbi:TPA: lysis protein, partial [Yersinia enterocolitica]|nr:lysis protein [Yersinia enterocolitica]
YRSKYLQAERFASERQSTIEEMVKRQQISAVLDAKYTQELADAKSQIEALRADVAAGRRRLRLNAQCVSTVSPQTGTASMDDATGPRLTDAAQRDYLRLRERIDIATKQITGLQEYINNVCLAK